MFARDRPVLVMAITIVVMIQVRCVALSNVRASKADRIMMKAKREMEKFDDDDVVSRDLPMVAISLRTKVIERCCSTNLSDRTPAA